MKNFTKSIVYSGVVLAAGLVAVFAIQNNMNGTQTQTPLFAIEPAAGTEGDYQVGGQSFIPVIEQMTEDSAEAIENMAEEASNVAEETLDAASKEANMALEAIDAGVIEAGEEIENALQNIMPASGETETE